MAAKILLKKRKKKKKIISNLLAQSMSLEKNKQVQVKKNLKTRQSTQNTEQKSNIINKVSIGSRTREPLTMTQSRRIPCSTPLTDRKSVV